MTEKESRPPRLSSWIINKLSIYHHRQTALGDLEEIYQHTLSESGKKAADRWYRRQALRSIPFLIRNVSYWAITMLRSNMKIAWRNIRKNKEHSFINIVGLSIGLGCCIFILHWVSFERSYNTFHENAENLHLVAFTNEEMTFYGDYLPGPAAEYMKETFPEILDAAYLGSERLKMTVEDRSFTSYGYYTQPSFFTLFTFPLLHGNPETALNEPLGIVISEETANRIFGETDVLGRSLLVNDRLDFTITGVLKEIPQNSSINFDFLISYQIAPRYMRVWDNKSVKTYVLLQSNASYEDVSNKIVNVFNDRNLQDTRNDFYLEPFLRTHLHALSGGGLITYIYVFSALAVVILVIACFNFMNLSTASSQRRMREIGVKKVVGSTRKQLIFQFISESVLISITALGFAVLVAYVILFLLSSTFSMQFIFQISVQNTLITLGLAVLTGIIAGSYPAFYLSSFSSVNIIKGQGYKGKSKGSVIFRRILVFTQFAASIIFIIGILSIAQQIYFMQSKDKGFNEENIVVIPLQGSIRGQALSLKEQLLNDPDIENISFISNDLTQWTSSAGISWPGKEEDNTFDVGMMQADYDFIETFQIEMAAGRFLSRDFPSDIDGAFVVNEAAVRAMKVDNPVGMTLTRFPGSSFEDPGTIIGVVKDFHTESMHGPIRPHLIYFYAVSPNMCVKIKTGRVASSIEKIRNAVLEASPGYPFSYYFLDDRFTRMYQAEVISGTFMMYLAGIAIFISCLGLFGLVAFAVQRRTKEVGIRKTFGATSSDIIGILSKEFIILVAAANLVAWPIAYYGIDKWLQNFYFRADIGIFTYILGGITALVIAFLTVYRQAIKAARANPIDSLRYE
ncbi:ABC transporter permease [candidate division KSB1 bacterium]